MYEDYALTDRQFHWQSQSQTSVISRMESRIKKINLFFIINQRRIEYEEIQSDPD
jgi:hypothetical protein